MSVATIRKTAECCGAPLYLSPSPREEIKDGIMRLVSEGWQNFDSLLKAMPSMWPSAILQALNELEGIGLIRYYHHSAFRDTIGRNPIEEIRP